MVFPHLLKGKKIPFVSKNKTCLESLTHNVHLILNHIKSSSILIGPIFSVEPVSHQTTYGKLSHFSLTHDPNVEAEESNSQAS